MERYRKIENRYNKLFTESFGVEVSRNETILLLQEITSQIMDNLPRPATSNVVSWWLHDRYGEEFIREYCQAGHNVKAVLDSWKNEKYFGVPYTKFDYQLGNIIYAN